MSSARNFLVKQRSLCVWDQEQRAAPRRSEVGVVPEVTWNVGRALRSLGHVFR